MDHQGPKPAGFAGTPVVVTFGMALPDLEKGGAVYRSAMSQRLFARAASLLQIGASGRVKELLYSGFAGLLFRRQRPVSCIFRYPVGRLLTPNTGIASTRPWQPCGHPLDHWHLPLPSSLWLQWQWVMDSSPPATQTASSSRERPSGPSASTFTRI